MKRGLSIVLLAIFAFNLGGYYLLFWVLKAQANQEIVSKLDDGQYNDGATFEIKIPLTLPYSTGSDEFERQHGQFTYQGEQYQVVKQKYEGDVLTIVCLKDTKATHLENVSNNFAENSGTHPTQEGSLNSPLKVFQDYIFSTVFISSVISGWIQSIQNTPYFSSTYQVNLLAFVPPPWA